MSTSASPSPSVPAPYVALLDDARFLAGPEASAADAVERFRELRAAHGEVVGSLLVLDRGLADLAGAVDGHELPVLVQLTGGAGAVGPAVGWAETCSGVVLTGLVAGLRDLDDLAAAARRTVAAAEAAGGPSLRVEVPMSGAGRPGWSAALDELAAAEATLQLDLRQSVPADLLAEVLDAALDRELPVAVRPGTTELLGDGTAPGVLSVLLAVRTALDGGDVTAALGSRDEAAARVRLEELGDDALTRARRWCVSGSSEDPAATARSLSRLVTG